MSYNFLRYYIRVKYDQHVWEYFNIYNSNTSTWNTTNKIPSDRLIEFYEREGSLDEHELMELIDSKFDLHFIEYYAKEYHSELLYQYFNVSETTASIWRSKGEIPNKRIKEFKERENYKEFTDYLIRWNF